LNSGYLRHRRKRISAGSIKRVPEIIKTAMSQTVLTRLTGPFHAFQLWSSRTFFPAFPQSHEEEFGRRYNEQSAPMVRMVLWMGAFIVLAFYFWDFVIDSGRSTSTFYVRLATSCYIVALASVPRALFANHLQAIAASGIVVTGVSVVVVISIIRDGLTFGIGGVILVLMFNFGFSRLLFIPSLFTGILISLAYNVAAISQGLALSLIVANNFFLITALGSGAFVTYLLERLYRSQFLISEELISERENLFRQHQADARYLDWLKKLAQFLRHEVRQPVAQISSSIDIIQLAHDQAGDVLQPYIASASLGVQHVWNLVERASQATDAEAFVRGSQFSVFDLTMLLHSIMDGFQQTHSGIEFDLLALLPVQVNADPMLIKEAIGNLLGNAASFADEGSVVKMTLHLEDRLVTVEVTNKGPVIEADTESLFGAFRSTRSSPASEHQGLGLYLVRLIAEQAGGSAGIANLEDRTGVRAWLSVPFV
jgi:signal transduction histidine kinase